jgi:5-methyltetrahydrofolate--homocysteine methyltransferase
MLDFGRALRSSEILIMDGAMGSELQRAGLPDGECSERWNLTHPDTVRGIHQAYVDAGSECLLTNTFQANPKALAKHGLAEKLSDICTAALAIARSAAGPDRFVIGDIGPILGLDGAREFFDQADVEQVSRALAGTDALLLETCSDPAALQAVRWCRAALGERELPVLLSLAYRKEPSGTLMSRSGHAPEWFAARAADSGVAALGVNCGRDMGIDEILEVIRRYRDATTLPLFARPNAGTPTRIDQRWHYPLSPDILASRLPELLETGIALVGGCCGTTPEHISRMRAIVQQTRQ